MHNGRRPATTPGAGVARAILDGFVAMWESPYEVVAARAAEGRERPIGYFCSYVPDEILHAAGFTPVRIIGAQRPIERAGAHLQAYGCSLARTGLELALSGELSFLEGTVFAQTCDTMQRLSDVWRLNTGFGFHADVIVPVRMGEASAERYLAEELARFRARVEEHADAPITDDALRASIKAYNRNRDLLERLYGLLAGGRAGLTGTQVIAAVMAGMWMRKEEHNRQLETLIAALEPAAANGEEDRRPRVLVSGSLCGSPDFVRMIEELGALVADDDLCTGHRSFENKVPEDGDPIEAIARRMSARANCPAKHSATLSRADDLVARAKEARAQGAIFYLQQFCDPHAWDYPHLRERLDQAGIPTLLIEWEHLAPASGQMRTRVEAFLEMIGD